MDMSGTFKLPESDLPVSKLVQALSPQYLTASYKLYWLLGMLDIIKDFPEEGSINIEFDDVIRRMIALSWYTILEYRLNFGSADQLERAVLIIEENTDLTKLSARDTIIETLEKTENEEIQSALKGFRRFVPYRFLTTFMDNMSGVPDSKKNKLIESASKTSRDVPYAIAGNTCIMNLDWLEYFYINNAVLKGWAQMKLVSFIQARNPNVPAIQEKLEAPRERDLSKARTYWRDYLSGNPAADIFASTPLDSSSISIDHFIPWSFVLHDRIWNLVPTSREVNSSKGNRLPPWERFFTGFAELQYNAFQWNINNKPKQKILEDFIIIKPDGINADISRAAFSSMLESTLQPVYRIAANQGFGIWEV